jgi:hypothetical protein
MQDISFNVTHFVLVFLCWTLKGKLDVSLSLKLDYKPA